VTPTIDLNIRRQLFAEDIALLANLRTPALIQALATVPREQFLPPGPWLLAGDTSWASDPHPTPDADPRHLYHNCFVAIDPQRLLFNAPPGHMALQIDALGLRPGGRVLHVGAGLGYYSALMGATVGPAGRALVIEVDERLAGAAAANLAAMPWVEVRHGNGIGPFDERFDGILINAGVTHPHSTWLDALAAGGRLALPLTSSKRKASTISRGVVLLIGRTVADAFEARVLTQVAIFSAIGLRDDALNQRLGELLAQSPSPRVTGFSRVSHEPGPGCWFHAPDFCFTSI
jgi:protein-L-isoaspartate(D-aspartate) O-methyltransferase